MDALRTSLISAEMLWRFCNVPFGVGIRVLKCLQDWCDAEEDRMPLQVQVVCMAFRMHTCPRACVHAMGRSNKCSTECIGD